MSCISGKEKYPSERWAVKFMRYYELIHGRQGMRWYWCPYCDGWHLSRQSRADRQRIKNMEKVAYNE